MEPGNDIPLYSSRITNTYIEYLTLNYPDVDIDSLRDLWRPEIEGGVSRGRFAGIMSHFILALNEGHTTIADIPVVYGTYLNPGLPVMFIGSGYRVSA